MGEDTEEIKFSEALVDVFGNGVEVNILDYAEDDPDDCYVHQACRHDEDANKYTPTGIAEYVDAAKRYNSKVPGHVAQRLANVNTCYSSFHYPYYQPCFRTSSFVDCVPFRPVLPRPL